MYKASYVLGTSGKGNPSSRRKNQDVDRGSSKIGQKREIWKMIEGVNENGEQPNTTLQHLYGHKKAAARRAVGKQIGKWRSE